MIHIIIPSPGFNGLLRDCVNSIELFTKGVKDYKIHIINTKKDAQITEFSEGYDNIDIYNAWFYHFATINNKAVFEWWKDQIKESDYIVFCNNDIVLKSDCISNMLDICKHESVGTVGALLFFEDGKIQHGGIFADGSTFCVGHIWYKRSPDAIKPEELYSNRVVIGNTAALMMIKAKDFIGMHGFDETFKICFEDVELNLRCLLAGKQNVICGSATALHKESVTRGKEFSKEDTARIRMRIAEFAYQKIVLAEKQKVDKDSKR